MRMIAYNGGRRRGEGLILAIYVRKYYVDVPALYFILSEFLTKNVLECIVNPTYLTGCCNSTLINLVLETIVLISNKTHKMGC